MTADKLIRKLTLIDENILAEASEQPEVFVEAARYRVDKMRRRVEATAALESFDAMESLRLRARKAARGEKPPLEYFKQKLIKNPRHMRLREQMERAEEREEFSKLILEAFRMRRDGIKIIADHQWYEGNKEAAEIERSVFNRKLSVQARRLEQKRKHLVQ